MENALLPRHLKAVLRCSTVVSSCFCGSICSSTSDGGRCNGLMAGASFRSQQRTWLPKVGKQSLPPGWSRFVLFSHEEYGSSKRRMLNWFSSSREFVGDRISEHSKLNLFSFASFEKKCQGPLRTTYMYIHASAEMGVASSLTTTENHRFVWLFCHVLFIYQSTWLVLANQLFSIFPPMYLSFFTINHTRPHCHNGI